jgi:hypothetical protein
MLLESALPTKEEAYFPIKKTQKKCYTHNPYAFGEKLKADKIASYLIQAATIQQNNSQDLAAVTQNNDDDDDDNAVTTQRRFNFQSQQEFMSALQQEQNPQIMLEILRSVPKEMLNEYNKEGQTVAHKFFRIYRKYDPVLEAAALGVDFTKPSNNNDKYPGSAIAHDIAGLLTKLVKSRRSNQKFIKSNLQRLHLLWQIDNGAHFNIKRPSSVWSLLKGAGLSKSFKKELNNLDHLLAYHQPKDQSVKPLNYDNSVDQVSDSTSKAIAQDDDKACAQQPLQYRIRRYTHNPYAFGEKLKADKAASLLHSTPTIQPPSCLQHLASQQLSVAQNDNDDDDNAQQSQRSRIRRYTHDPYAFGRELAKNAAEIKAKKDASCLNQTTTDQQQNQLQRFLPAPLIGGHDDDCKLVTTSTYKQPNHSHNLVRISQNDNDDDDNDTVTTQPRFNFQSQQEFMSALQQEQNPQTMLEILRSVPKEMLNEYNNQGQTVAHNFFRTDRKYNPVLEAAALGLDFTKPTNDNDKYHGSTVAHNIAGVLIKFTEKRHYKQKFIKAKLQCLHLLWQIDNGAHFNTKESNERQRTIWDLLEFSDRLNDFLDLVKDHTHVPEKYRRSYQIYCELKQ